MLTISLMGLFFLLTIIYVLPLNPIRVKIKPLLDHTIGTYFPQNWSLFAPTPVSQDYILLVQPLQSKSDVLKGKGWFNLSSPLWRQFHKHRFSAYDRLARSQTNALKSVLTGDARLLVYMNACQKGDTAACRIYKKSITLIREEQITKLVKIGSAFCNDLIDGHRYKYLALRVRIVSIPPWSERYTGKKTNQDIDLGQHPIDKKTAPFGLFN